MTTTNQEKEQGLEASSNFYYCRSWLGIRIWACLEASSNFYYCRYGDLGPASLRLEASSNFYYCRSWLGIRIWACLEASSNFYYCRCAPLHHTQFGLEASSNFYYCRFYSQVKAALAKKLHVISTIVDTIVTLLITMPTSIKNIRQKIVFPISKVNPSRQESRLNKDFL